MAGSLTDGLGAHRCFRANRRELLHCTRTRRALPLCQSRDSRGTVWCYAGASIRLPRGRSHEGLQSPGRRPAGVKFAGETAVDIAAWLAAWGSSATPRRFVTTRSTSKSSRELTDVDLEKLGVPLGHRKKLLKAIAGLLREPDSHGRRRTTLAERAARRGRTAAADGDVRAIWSARPSSRRGSTPRTWAR